jgi:hypothetical protein
LLHPTGRESRIHLAMKASILAIHFIAMPRIARFSQQYVKGTGMPNQEFRGATVRLDARLQKAYDNYEHMIDTPEK